jgi:hypothetical protein
MHENLLSGNFLPSFTKGGEDQVRMDADQGWLIYQKVLEAVYFYLSFVICFMGFKEIGMLKHWQSCRVFSSPSLAITQACWEE